LLTQAGGANLPRRTNTTEELMPMPYMLKTSGTNVAPSNFNRCHTNQLIREHRNRRPTGIEEMDNSAMELDLSASKCGIMRESYRPDNTPEFAHDDADEDDLSMESVSSLEPDEDDDNYKEQQPIAKRKRKHEKDWSKPSQITVVDNVSTLDNFRNKPLRRLTRSASENEVVKNSTEGDNDNDHTKVKRASIYRGAAMAQARGYGSLNSLYGGSFNNLYSKRRDEDDDDEDGERLKPKPLEQTEATTGISFNLRRSSLTRSKSLDDDSQSSISRLEQSLSNLLGDASDHSNLSLSRQLADDGKRDPNNSLTHMHAHLHNLPRDGACKHCALAKRKARALSMTTSDCTGGTSNAFDASFGHIRCNHAPVGKSKSAGSPQSKGEVSPRPQKAEVSPKPRNMITAWATDSPQKTAHPAWATNSPKKTTPARKTEDNSMDQSLKVQDLALGSYKEQQMGAVTPLPKNTIDRGAALAARSHTRIGCTSALDHSMEQSLGFSDLKLDSCSNLDSSAADSSSQPAVIAPLLSKQPIGRSKSNKEGQAIASLLSKQPVARSWSNEEGQMPARALYDEAIANATSHESTVSSPSKEATVPSLYKEVVGLSSKPPGASLPKEKEIPQRQASKSFSRLQRAFGGSDRRTALLEGGSERHSLSRRNLMSAPERRQSVRNLMASSNDSQSKKMVDSSGFVTGSRIRRIDDASQLLKFEENGCRRPNSSNLKEIVKKGRSQSMDMSDKTRDDAAEHEREKGVFLGMMKSLK
jgi:hypothetical protein